jgi:hypothetical protein
VITHKNWDKAFNLLRNLSAAIQNHAKAIVQIEIRSQFVLESLICTVENFYNVVVGGLNLIKESDSLDNWLKLFVEYCKRPDAIQKL